MREEKLGLSPGSERFDYPPILNAIVPLIMLIASGAYAWSLRAVVNPEMNLLLLKPLFAAIWLFLLVVLVDDVIPSIRLQAAWRASAQAPAPFRERFAPGTEANARLVVLATFAFACVGVGNGWLQYVVSAFIYLLVTGYLIGDRRPVTLVFQAIAFSIGLYLVLGTLLGVRF
jgi:uncharacterized membrane protein